MSHGQVSTWLAWVPKENAELAHRVFKTNGWLRSDVHPLTKSDLVGFPLLHKPPQEALERTCKGRFPMPQMNTQEVTVLPSIVPHASMRHAADMWLKERNIVTNELLESLPKKWERLGELILLPYGTFDGTAWNEVKSHAELPTLWHQIAESLGGTSLALQAPIANDGYRSPQIELLHGTTEVRFTDHNVAYAFDAGQVMWSSGNVTERRRIGTLDLTGEVVIDAYAGVGYYTLPMLVHGKAACVHACEWNPASIEGLRTSAALNGVESRLRVHDGDNAASMATLHGVANRVHLGLLPSSEPAWEAAIRCLKDEGGWLHVHMNVEEKAIDDWVKATVNNLNLIASEWQRPWRLKPHHLERVKWFSPRVRHVVLDVQTVVNSMN